MIPENYQTWPKVIVTNEESCSFTSILNILHNRHSIFENGLTTLKCKEGVTIPTIGNKFKKISLQYVPYEGVFPFQFQQKQFVVKVTKGQCKITTQCRQIDYIRELIIYGESIPVIKQFFTEAVEKAEPVDQSKITIYENNNGYWNISKQKKPRRMESVIFKKDFIDIVIEDVKEFIASEQWYVEMGIPYKRSYLLYGPPGTGKSSFAQALAGYIGFSICFVNCSDKVSDFQFNSLLNKAPKKSIILIEDVDSIFSERKNTEKNNTLTFSGFLNAIDGVRSQEGRILMMTTNYKEKLDPALLRPGRVDQMYEVNFASKFQMKGICYRFFKDEKIAKDFSDALPQGQFSMSMIQGFLLKYRKKPEQIANCINQILESDQNIKIDQFLTEINCLQVLNDFKIEECFSLSSARDLPKETLEKMISKLIPLKKGRLLETIRQDRRIYVKKPEALKTFIEQNYKNEQLARRLQQYVEKQALKTYFQIRDYANKIEEENKIEA